MAKPLLNRAFAATGRACELRKIIITLGIICCASSSVAQELPTFVINVDRFVVEGENPLSPATTDEVLSEYTGSYDSLDGLLAAKDALGVCRT